MTEQPPQREDLNDNQKLFGALYDYTLAKYFGVDVGVLPATDSLFEYKRLVVNRANILTQLGQTEYQLSTLSGADQIPERKRIAPPVIEAYKTQTSIGIKVDDLDPEITPTNKVRLRKSREGKWQLIMKQQTLTAYDAALMGELSHELIAADLRDNNNDQIPILNVHLDDQRRQRLANADINPPYGANRIGDIVYVLYVSRLEKSSS